MITVSIAVTFFRAQGFGADNVPNGPLIVAPNHASFMDHFFAGAFIRRHIQFMAKSQMFGNHVMSYVFSHGGVFPVRRGYADEEAFKTAFTILDRGGAIGMYVEGGRSRNGRVGEDAKAGIGRLALETGAAVVPVAILGSHRVRNWTRLRFPKVVVRYGKAIRFEQVDNPTREQQQACADEILRRIRDDARGARAGRTARGSRRRAPERRRRARLTALRRQDDSASGAESPTGAYMLRRSWL